MFIKSNATNGQVKNIIVSMLFNPCNVLMNELMITCFGMKSGNRNSFTLKLSNGGQTKSLRFLSEAFVIPLGAK